MKDTIKLLLLWYNENDYDLPWRKTTNPYKIWISEIMLQQTQVNTVKGYYNEWIKKFPTIQKLAGSHIDDILKIWEGLGYYQRAHNIHATSKIIIKKYKGGIPNSYIDLIKLRGIGDYTASAILSIAYNKPYPAIDGNLKRVISRLYMLSNRKNIINIAKSKISPSMKSFYPSDINQALMDLGREICTSKKPSCTICPIRQKCLSYRNNKVDLFPTRVKLKKIKFYNIVAGMIWKNNKLLINKRKKMVY